MYNKSEKFRIIQLIAPCRPLMAHLLVRNSDEIFRAVEYVALCDDGEIRTISLSDNGTGYFIVNESEELDINGNFLYGDLQGIYPAEYIAESMSENE